MLMVDVPPNRALTENPPEVYQGEGGRARLVPENIPVIHHLNEEEGIRTWTASEDEDSYLSTRPMDDGEFLQRLKPEAGAGPSPRFPQPPPVPPRRPPQTTGTGFEINEEPEEKRHSSRFLSVFVWLTTFLILVGLTGGLVWFYLNGNPSGKEPEPTAEAKVSIPIDGKVVYYDAANRSRGDEGAIIFLFPPDYKIEQALATGLLSPVRPTPAAVKPTLEKLRAQGGQYARAASDGMFDIRINKTGKYKILIVSAHVPRHNVNSDSQKLQEVSKYLFKPDLTLVSDHAFYWGEQVLDQNNFRVEYNFGKIN